MEAGAALGSALAAGTQAPISQSVAMHHHNPRIRRRPVRPATAPVDEAPPASPFMIPAFVTFPGDGRGTTHSRDP